jgi:WD40 repeat protein
MAVLSLHLPLRAQYFFNVKRTLKEMSHQVYFTSYSPDGKYILSTGSDNSIIIWNSETGIIYRTLTGLKKRPNAGVISGNMKLVISGGEDNLLSIWDPEKMEVTRTLSGHNGAIKSLDISPDGKLIASGSTDKTIRVWNLNTRNLVYELKAHKNVINTITFSPDGKMLASGGGDRALIIWDVSNGNIINSKTAHRGWIRDIAFSNDGELIATCGDDKLIHIWESRELTKIMTLEGHRDWVQTIAFSPDGKSLLSGGHDQIIILWDIATGKILQQSARQGQIILSLDIHPLKPDFVSASLLSEELKIWALSGLDQQQWTLKNNKVSSIQETVSDEKPLKNEASPKIELYSPVIKERSRVEHDKKDLALVGRVIDPAGVSVFMINQLPVKLNDAGVFQYNISLESGENPVSLIAVNNNGEITETLIKVDFSEIQSREKQIILPEIHKSRYFAVLIGINDYSDNNINDLDNPIRDAEDLSRVLLSAYNFEEENIILLRNPGRREMIMALDELSRNLTNQDNLLIFFAGHGYWDDKGKVGYWLPSDASRYNTVEWFRNSTLRDFIGSINTRHTMLIADACFSGAIFKTRAAFTDIPKSIEKLYELPSRKAMTSGILQEVPDESVFVKYLVKHLEENKEKYLPSEVLFSSFKSIVMNNSPNIPQFGVIQNVGDEGGDFIFIRK